MATPCIAHYGITIIEDAPPPGVEQNSVPITGALKGNLDFLELLGFRPLLQNFYAGVGRQYIWARGAHTDPDYVEQDNFTSYSAKPRPTNGGPHQGDTIFRLTHRDPTTALRILRARELVQVEATAAEAFMRGEREWLLITSPAGQVYEFGASSLHAADNHVVYVWTRDSDLADARRDYREHFGLEHVRTADFHGLGRVELLRRESPGATIGLLHSATNGLAPRWSEDIFGEAGYPHFRLGAPDKAVTEAASRQAFPPGGDVSYVYFADSYLELVQA